MREEEAEPEGPSCTPPGYLTDPGIEPTSLLSPALAGRFLPLAPPGKQIMLSLIGVAGGLIAVASLVAEHRL